MPCSFASFEIEASDIGFRTLGGTHSAAALGARKPSERKRMSDFVERKLTMLEDALITERQHREKVESELNDLARARAAKSRNRRSVKKKALALPSVYKRTNGGDFVNGGLTRRVPKTSSIKMPKTKRVGQASSLPRLDHRRFIRDNVHTVPVRRG